MRLLAACSLGGAGHLNPLVPLVDAGRRRGDEVLVVGPPAMEELVRATGHAFWAGGEPEERDVAPIRERLPLVPKEEASVLGNRELFGRLATRAMLPGMEAAFEAWRPELVLRDPCEYASAVVAGRLGVRAAQVAISLAEVEAGSIDVAAPALEEHAAGLPSALRSSPYLTRFPARLDPSPFPTTIRFRPDDRPPTSLPDWWAGSTGPLVYVSFGTVLGHMTRAADVFTAAAQAVDGLPVRVLLTVGRRFDPSLLGDLPANVHVEPWVDQADVLAQADLVVSHGGSGTLFGALAAGVPVVAVPLFADQFENSRRLEQSGAGIVVRTGRTVATDAPALVDAGTEQRLASAIRTALATPGLVVRARQVADDMQAAPSPGEVLDALADGALSPSSRRGPAAAPPRPGGG